MMSLLERQQEREKLIELKVKMDIAFAQALARIDADIEKWGKEEQRCRII